MICPVKILEYDLADSAFADLLLPDRYVEARVLVRWSGRPVGTVKVPVINGYIRQADIATTVQAQLEPALAVEFVRYSLLHHGTPRAFTLQRPAAPDSPRPRRRSLSVVICTRDRPHDLEICLTAIASLDPAPFEVIVVDNAPTTDASARLLRERFPQFRLAHEETPGLDHARNRGIREARGDIIAFTDDDVAVDPGWAGAIVTAFAEDPSIGLLTGLVEPLELESEAQILFESYGGFGRGYVRKYLQAPSVGPLPWPMIGAGELSAGANMAVRKELFDQVGLFNPALDVGTATRGGGDHEMFFRLIKSGCLCVYDPAALVRHRHRRSLHELTALLYDYGRATRAFFDAVQIHFPEHAVQVRRLRRWWWHKWALRKWRRGAWRPARFPSRFVAAEITGYWEARGVYALERKKLVPNEQVRPDRFNVTWSPRSFRQGIGSVFVDIDQPLAALPADVHHRRVRVIVRAAGEPLGSFLLITEGRPVSAARLADEIAASLAAPILAFRDRTLPSAGFPADLRHVLAVPPSRWQALPSPISASVIVATCNRPDALHRCLSSLTRLRTDRRVQIIVVDNRPALGRAPGIVAQFPGVECVSEFRAGSSYARNAGIAVARGDIVAITDDDMVVAEDWLERLLEPFSRANVMAVAGCTLPAQTETPAERWFETYGGFCRGFQARDYTPDWFLRARRSAVPTWKIGGSGNAAFRRELFHRPEIGRFDLRLGAGMPTGVGEDTHLFYAILHAGYTIAYRPAAVAWHHHRITMPQLRAQLLAYGKGHVAYHLVTLIDYKDGRALLRLLFGMPWSFAQRVWRRLSGRSDLPWHLLLIETAGNLCGPWSLWRAHRQVRQYRTAGDHSPTIASPCAPSPATGPPALLTSQPVTPDHSPSYPPATKASRPLYLSRNT